MIERWFPNLARHWSILKESWKIQDLAQANAKPQSDHEFLPAALEIMEKPPSPGLRWLMLSLCGMFAIALVWSFIGKIDVVATASGKVIPAGNVKIIQPIEIGYVRKIHVTNGQHVKAGQLLVELDPTLSGAEAEQASQGLVSAEILEARNAALLDHIRGRPAKFKAPAGTLPVVAETQSNFVRTSIAEYEGERASLLQQRSERVSDLAGAEAEVAKLKQTLPLIEQQLSARKELADKGYFSKIRLLEYEQLRIEHIQNIAVQEANASKLRAAMANIDAQLLRLKGSFGKNAVSELAQAQEQQVLSRQEVTKSNRRKEFQQLRAPVSGTVQQLTISTVGGVVQPAQALMIIVPDDGAMFVEANILNKDIGFIRKGQPVRLKFEAFTFTDYGVIPAVVDDISRDALNIDSLSPQPNSRNNPPVQSNLLYVARIRLLKSSIQINGKKYNINPGLAVQAEIKTGQRRIIDFLISPIARTLDESGRER